MNPSSIESKSLECILYLDYALAGDPEAAELTRQLKLRHREIAWNAPSFVAASRFARGEREEPPLPEGEIASTIYNLQDALLASQEKLESNVAQYADLAKRSMSMGESAKSLYELVSRMRDRLETLGADTSEFELPKREP